MRVNRTFWPGAGELRSADGGGGAHASGGPPVASRPHVSFAITQRELEGATTLVTVEGELDLASAQSLKWALTDIIKAGVSQIVVDLSPVTFIDSTALGVLVGVHRSLGSDARLALAGADADVLNIFELTGLDSTFDMFPTLDGAIAWVRGSEAAAG